MDIKNFFVNMADELAENLGQYNFKRRTARLKRENIAIEKENIFVKYNRLVENILIDFNLDKRLTLESFTSLLAIVFALFVLIVTFFIQDVTFSLLIAISIVIGLFTYFTMQSRMMQVRRAEAISDAEDAICPLAHGGVLVAIKKVMENEEYIHKSLRPYFYEFIDNCEMGGYSFRQAMELLNRRLGSRFDNFAKKAVIFEYNERKGMADVFMDIVDENAVIREINAKKEERFRQMNRDFILKVAIIVLFFLYALSSAGFRNFILFSGAGKFINSISLNVICISFAAGQALQGSLELKRRGSQK
jgi:ABC-type multidrug transport system fused ATPase/permease subunit